MSNSDDPFDLDADARSARILDLEAKLKATEDTLRELQHRAKNSLQLVISLLRLQQHRINDPESRAAYDQIMRRVEVLAVLYRQFHEARSSGAVELAPYLREIVESAAAAEGDPGMPLVLDMEMAPLQTSLYTAMPLGLATNELVICALRHAFPTSGRLCVRLEAAGVGGARLTVEDNGKRLPTGFDREQDASVMLVEALATQLDADLDVTDNVGSRVILTFRL